MINLLFLGVPVVLLAMDKYVAIYNMVAAFGVIVITLLVRLCFFRKFMLSDLSNYLYLLSSLWLTALIIWATVEGNINAKYETVSIVQNEYFNIITGVLIACNPVVWAVVLFIVGIACCLALALIVLVLALIGLVLALIVLVPVGIYYGMRFLYRQCKKCCK